MCKEAQEAALGKGKETVVGSTPHEVKWRLPEEGWFKINVNVGKVGENGSGHGVVFSVCRGGLVFYESVQLTAWWEPRVAETLAVLEGVKIVVHQG